MFFAYYFDEAVAAEGFQPFSLKQKVNNSGRISTFKKINFQEGIQLQKKVSF